MEDFIVLMRGDEELKVFYKHAPREDDDEYVEIGEIIYKGIDVSDLIFACSKSKSAMRWWNALSEQGRLPLNHQLVKRLIG